MRAGFILFVTFLFSCAAISSTVAIPLPDAVGSISTSGKTIAFNAGTNFRSISQVNLHCRGIICYGLGCGDGVERPVLPYFSWPAIIQTYMDPPGAGMWLASFGAGEGAFNQEKTFSGTLGVTWDFLLDGQADIRIYLNPSYVIGGVMLQSPSGTISEAHISILGTILDIIAPASGQYLYSGSICKIEWQDCNGRKYLLDYSIDGGTNWIPINTSLIEDSHFYNWLVPNINSQQCKIRITDANDPNFSDSSGQFTIYQCQETLEGDINNDCYVNFLDYAIIAANNQDYIDFKDYAILVDNWCMCGNPYDPNCN
jgi:hypothetical protein